MDKRLILDILLADLEVVAERRDGMAAVRIIDRVRAIAGDVTADLLLTELTTAGLRRLNP